MSLDRADAIIEGAPSVISNGAGRLFLPHSLLRMRRPEQREISLRFGHRGALVDYFKALADETGLPYQKLIDLYLLDCLCSAGLFILSEVEGPRIVGRAFCVPVVATELPQAKSDAFRERSETLVVCESEHISACLKRMLDRGSG